MEDQGRSGGSWGIEDLRTHGDVIDNAGWPLPSTESATDTNDLAEACLQYPKPLSPRMRV